MDLAYTSEQQLVGAALAPVFERATLTRLRAAEPSGFDRELWDEVVKCDLPLGSEWEDEHLVAAAEMLGSTLAPIPLIEVWTALAALHASGRSGQSWADRVASGEAIVTCALHPPSSHGALPLVPGGAIADAIVVPVDGSFIIHEGGRVSELRRTTGAAPLADWSLARGTSTPLDVPRGLVDSLMRDRWKTLTASALVGLAQGALDLVVERVKHRVQFGVPIGSFQAVQHRLADLATAVEGARLLTARAACDRDGWESVYRPTMAFVFATDTARAVTAACVQFHGGLGFTLEGDAQLFYRRAKAWPLVLGDPTEQLRVLGDLMYGGSADQSDRG